MDWAVSTTMTLEDHVSATFRRMEAGTRSFGDAAEKSFRRASSSSSRFGDIVKGVMAADLIRSAVSSLWDMGKASVQLASDMTEVQNVVDTTFGKDAASINAWSQSAIKAFGLSELQAKQFNGTMGALLKSSGIAGDELVKMSTGLSGLAGDFASFYNLPIEQAFEKLRSGISGETEPLKQLGINMSVANLEAFALSKGIKQNFKDMSQAEQAMLRYNFILKASADAQGDFAKTLSTSFANQQRVLETKLKQAGATVMSKFLPVLTDALSKINAYIDRVDFTKISDNVGMAVGYMVSTFQVLWPVISTTASILGTLFQWIYALRGPLIALTVAFAAYRTIMMTMGIISTVTTMITTLQGGIILAGGAMGFFNAMIVANPIMWIVGAIALMIGAIAAAIIYWDEITAAVKGFLGLSDAASSKMDSMAEKAAKASSAAAVSVPGANITAMPGGIGPGAGMTMPAIGGEGGGSMAIPEIPSQAQITAPTPESQTQKMKLEFYGRIDVFGLPKESKFTRTGGNAPDIDVALLGENK